MGYLSFTEVERGNEALLSLVTEAASANGRLGNATQKTEEKAAVSPQQTNGVGGRSRLFPRLSFYRAIQNGVPANAQGLPAHLKFSFDEMHNYFRASLPLESLKKATILNDFAISSMANNNIEQTEAKSPQSVPGENLINL